MPSSSQSLYFHLGMNADDDGFCEHFTIMRMTDSKPDDLKVLQAKGFVAVFDDKVLVVTDWKENNYIQKDRYTPSKYLEIYKEELKQIAGGIQNVYNTDTQVRLGKDRLGKVSLNTKEGEDKRNPDVQEIWELGINLGFTQTKQHLNRYAIQRLIKTHGKEKVKQFAEYSVKIREHQYAPRINNFMDLEDKLLKLKDFADRQKAKSQRIVEIDI